MRQGETIESAVADAQNIEPKESEVNLEDRLADNCGQEQMSETSTEVDMDLTEDLEVL